VTAIAFDPHVALVVVDVQNDFADPQGSLSVKGGDAIVSRVNKLVVAARSSHSTITYTQDWHPPDTPHFAKDGGIWPVHCVRDTWGAAFHPDLVVDGEVVRKGTGGEDGYSGFTMREPVTGEDASTGLDERLHAHGVEAVVVVGLATDYCVKATALDAVHLNYPTTVVRDCVAAVDVDPGDGDLALRELEAAGVTLA
jgi:nicotinamidase/pyrazinamidase